MPTTPCDARLIKLQKTIDSIGTANTMAKVTKLAGKATTHLNKALASANEEVAKAAEYLDLLTPPTTPAEVITWAGKVITKVIGPMYKPYATQAAEVICITSMGALVASAVADATTRLSNPMSLIPPLPMVPPLPQIPPIVPEGK